MAARRVRIGIDTGGTFTDVVAVDEETGRTTTTKTPSTPADPAEGFLNGVRKVLGLMELDGDAVTAASHGTTVATNQLLEGKLDRIGFITTEGYESVLEIARQSVPDGYGNSYFWVKPPRIVPADLVRTVRGRLDFRGVEVRPFDPDDAVAAVRFFRDAGIRTIGVCLLHSYATDVTVVIDGEPTLTTEGSVGDYPSKIPMIDVVTVGAGGGSIAWLSPEGTLKVGPRSAGADPGPICYPNGGDQPTVTDAHVVLGRIPPHLLGGEIPLSVEAAIDGHAGLGAKLDLSLERTATGILEISAWNQANALRQVTVARGLDVRDFTLTTFGGSGSLLACRLMDILGLPRTLVPPNPGNVSAFGLLTVDVRNDYVQTVVSKHADLDLDRVQAVFGDLESPAQKALDGEGFDREQQRMQRTADLRYVGQAFEVRVPVEDGDLDAAALDAVATA